MVVHNVLILVAYLLLGLAASLGLPGFAVWPAFLSLPLGLLQIYQMWRISNGFKPNWTAVTLTGLALFAFMAYMITYAYWTN
jgi:hypothetical protein